MFNIQGQLYHHYGQLEPSGPSPVFSQIYMCSNPQEELQHRQVEREINQILQRVIHRYNPLLFLFPVSIFLNK